MLLAEREEETLSPPAADAQPGRVHMLICEGRCNHGIRDVDRAVSRDYAQHGRLSDRSRALLRTLQHTPHDPTGDGRYICRACRRIRTCGGEG